MAPARTLVPSSSTPGPQGCRVIVVGAGGNIGSHLVPHLARMAAVSEVVLIDPGVYEPANLVAQDITPADVGRRKVSVQARRLARINPSLVVTAIPEAVENLPVGRLEADVILACLDSRAARQSVNRRAWLLGVPWIDAGVHADGLLAQVAVYVPGESNPCIECSWDDRDYAALEQTYPCLDGRAEQPATGAPSSLGALAASLQAIECAKLLRGETGGAAIGRRVLVDAAAHKHYVTEVRRTAVCRLADHEPWKRTRFACSLSQATVDDVLRLGDSDTARSWWAVAGRHFVTALTCPACAAERRALRLAGAKGALGRCATCGGALVATGFNRRDRLRFDELAAIRSRSLASIGLRDGDLFTVDRAGERLHFVVADVTREPRASERG